MNRMRAALILSLPLMPLIGACPPSTIQPSGNQGNGGGTAPPNDNCGSATAITEGQIQFTTSGATTDGPSVASSCTQSRDDQIGADIWYCYTPTDNGNVTVSVCGSDYASKLAVYLGCTCPTSAGSELACDINSCSNGGSQAAFTATAGQAYLIRIGGVTGANGTAATGSGTLNVTRTKTVPPPVNDTADKAIPVTTGTTVFDNTGATTDGPAEPACAAGGSDQIGADIWYCFTATKTGPATVSLCGTPFPTRLAVYSGCTTPMAGGTALACDSNSCPTGNGPEVHFDATVGQEYLIRIGSPAESGSASTGSGTMTITNVLAPPVNDTCAQAIPVTEGTTTFDTGGALTDGSPEPGCASGGDDQVGADIWYCYTAGNTGTATVSLCGSAFSTKLAVYKGCSCPTSGSAIACDVNHCGAGGASETSFDAIGGEKYLIRIGGVTGSDGVTATGKGVMDISLTLPPPVNDSCADPIPVSEGTIAFDSTGATTDGPAEPDCASGADDQIGGDIWYCYTPSMNGTGIVSLCGTPFNTKLAVYKGCACPSGPGKALVCDDDFCGPGGASQVRFAAFASQKYLIRIGGATTNGKPATGPGVMHITVEGNDRCSHPIQVAEGSFPVDTTQATTDGPNEALCSSGNPQIGADVWYCYSPTRTGTVTFSLCRNTNFDSKIAVYYGCSCPTADNTAAVCDDDGCGTRGGPSRVKLTVKAGSKYLVRVGGTVSSNGTPATGTGTLDITYDGMPDIIFDKAAINPVIITKTFSAGDCALNECATIGTRKLINFTGQLDNIGKADLVLGNPAVNSLFYWDPCHGHYHIKGFADYLLKDSSGQVAAGLKFGFCVRDDKRMSSSAPASAMYNCSYQGIQAGWADVYAASLPCQWIDITGVPSGDYTLELIANPDHLIPEANYGNNSTSVPIHIP